MAVQKLIPMLEVAVREIIRAGGYGAISVLIEPASGGRGGYRVKFTYAPSILVKFGVEEGQTQQNIA